MGVVVPLESDRGQGSDAVERLTALVGADMERVTELILSRLASQVEMVPELAGHIVESGGKRLRPMMTLAAAEICGYQGTDHVKLAAAVELMHTATLLHDDVVDESDLRRGKQAARKIWGNQASVLVGDFLLGRAFKLMVEVGSLKALDILSSSACVIAEGEVLQLATTKDTRTTEDAYLQVVNAKTAALFAAATEVGAVVADRPDSEQAALASYGRNLGVAFQLVDDALDYSGRQATLGKTVGDDFREGKLTLPVVLAYRRGTADERAFWERTLRDGDQQDGDMENAIAIMERHGCLDDTIGRARHYGAIACDALAIFPESEMRDVLISLVHFCVNRSY